MLTWPRGGRPAARQRWLLGCVLLTGGTVLPAVLGAQVNRADVAEFLATIIADYAAGGSQYAGKGMYISC
jgi:hypothetical protein